MNILKYTKEQIQQYIKDGLCDVQTLRDWEIAKAKEREQELTAKVRADTQKLLALEEQRTRELEQQREIEKLVRAQAAKKAG